MKGTINTQGRKTIVMYAQPNIKAEELAELEHNDIVEATERKGNWLHVVYSGVDGWVKDEYVKLDGQMNGFLDTIKSFFTGKKVDASGLAQTGANVVTAMSESAKADTKVGKTMVVNTATDPLTMRNAPSGTKIASIAKGAQVVIAQDGTTKADGYDWVKINYGGQTGYVAGQYLTEVSNAKPTDTPVTDVATTDNNNSNTEKKMTLSENAKKYAKYGLIAVVAGAGLFFGYKALKGGEKKTTSSRKGLSGIGRKKKKKYKRLELK